MSKMDNEEEASLSQEEELIDSLFFRCDTHGEGKVLVYTVIQFLKNCLGNGNVSCYVDFRLVISRRGVS
jgi:hypothetical protein